MVNLVVTLQYYNKISIIKIIKNTHTIELVSLVSLLVILTSFCTIFISQFTSYASKSQSMHTLGFGSIAKMSC